MDILTLTVRVLITYILSCCISVALLMVAGAFEDIEQISWMIYSYLHSHYNIYDEIHNYDFNPALGDFLISWVLLFPIVMTFTLLKVNSIFTRKCEKN
ncbi:hypothetical protein EJS37_24715 [Salmonella enterica]|nr:hypothetical protein [Salmonella enterica]